MLLAGDIGGTKTVLAIYEASSDLNQPLAEATYPSDQYSGLEVIAQAFLEETGYPVTTASFGVAGPVVDGHVKTTNLPWEMDETMLRETLGLERAFLLNDLESIANAVPRLRDEDVLTLNEGRPEHGGSIGIVAPGTGLGEGFLTWDGGHYRAYPSEGGHTDFAPINDTEIELLRYLQKRVEHVSYEWVCSGMGLPSVYEFFKDSGYAPEPDWLREKLAAAPDKTPVIVNTAIDPELDSPLCDATLDLFIKVLGRETGNMALTLMATGGMYLGGGIPPRILPTLQDGRFMQAYLNKGRFTDLLRRVPVRVILNAKAALWGAAAFGQDQMNAS